MSTEIEHLREQIKRLVGQYYDVAFPPCDFIKGVTPIPASCKVFDAREIQLLVDAALDFHLTTGRFAHAFERDFAQLFQVRHALLVNSGSSANLLAVAALTSPKLLDRRLRPGDEVITVATGFPTTVNPLIQQCLIPVFVDVEIPTYNIDVTQLDSALSPRTRAIMLAHTLGNPFNVAAVRQFADDHGLWLIEDCCDAVGATFRDRPVGSFGDLATVSFYPAHHITMGEGGCVLTNDSLLKKLVESYRDWGRDCWCEPGKDNTCGRRFSWQLGDLPAGYDHKYTYSHIGYNLKATEMQAAVGLAQLQKLPSFIDARRLNFSTLKDSLYDLQGFFILPESTPHSEPSWFGFPLAVTKATNRSRTEIVRYLESKGIGTRLLFGGNLIRQPAYREATFRTVGDLPNATFVMNNVFWIGVHPGLTPAMLAHISESLRCIALQTS